MQTSRQAAYNHIRRLIMTGDLQAGARLLEPDIASAIGVSRTPVREAIIQLEMDGVVEQVPRLGAYIKTPRVRDLEELFKLREVLEPAAAAWATEHITDTQLHLLKRVHQQFKQLAKLARRATDEADRGSCTRLMALHDAALHALILQAADSPRIVKIVGDFQILTHVFGHFFTGPEGETADHVLSCLEHGRIIRALQSRNANDAQKWMREHLRRARESAISAFNAQQRANTVEQYEALPADQKFLQRLGGSFDLSVVESLLSAPGA